MKFILIIYFVEHNMSKISSQCVTIKQIINEISDALFWYLVFELVCISHETSIQTSHAPSAQWLRVASGTSLDRAIHVVPQGPLCNCQGKWVPSRGMTGGIPLGPPRTRLIYPTTRGANQVSRKEGGKAKISPIC